MVAGTGLVGHGALDRCRRHGVWFADKATAAGWLLEQNILQGHVPLADNRRRWTAPPRPGAD